MTWKVLNDKTPKLSYSLLDAWGTCQLRTFYDRTGEKPKPTFAMSRGTQAHKAMELVAENLRAGQEAERAVGEVRLNPPEGPLPPGILTSWLDHARPMFKGLSVKSTERWFAEGSNPWKLRGFIDLETFNTPVFDDMGAPTGEVREGACVLDYKTIGQARYCKAPWEVERSLQAAIYSIVTGVRRFAYVYLLPNGEVRATIAEIPEEAIVRHANWLNVAIRGLHASWAHMRALLEAGEDPAEAFSPAAAGHPFCSPKCSHSARCGVFPE
jgi:hypothetical protein